MDYKNIGAYIKQRRTEKKISLNKFCIMNDMEPAILSRIENGLQGIKLEVLIKIAAGFNQTPAQFLLDFENSKT